METQVQLFMTVPGLLQCRVVLGEVVSIYKADRNGFLFAVSPESRTEMMSRSIPLLMLRRTKRTDDVQHPYRSLLEMAFLVC